MGVPPVPVPLVSGAAGGGLSTLLGLAIGVAISVAAWWSVRRIGAQPSSAGPMPYGSRDPLDEMRPEAPPVLAQ